jgi:two-component system, OmpR family, response regulator RegX3
VATAARAAAEVARATDDVETERVREGGSGRPLARHPEPPPPYDPDVAVGKRRILLVEDEASIVAPLADALRREGFETHVAGTVEEALAAGRSADPDLVLLDLMLPDGSGLDVCRELRRTSDVPIVMLTARGDEADRVVGLELGADDYVVKPFSAREVIARIRAVLRRAGAPSEPASEPIHIGDVSLDPGRRSVQVAGEDVDLARREFELLHRLMMGAGNVITREQLIEDVWDMNWFGSTKTLDVHVSSVRRKLGDDPSNPRYIHTVRGVGFRFSAPRELES